MPFALHAADAKYLSSKRACRGLSLRESKGDTSHVSYRCGSPHPPRLGVVASSRDAKRVALVIGMSDYQHLSKLPNPVPDAKAIAAEFKATGADVALVNAGHGMSFRGKNLIDARGEFRQ